MRTTVDPKMSSKFEELQDGEADFMVTYVNGRGRMSWTALTSLFHGD
jgi:hypothetical protein